MSETRLTPERRAELARLCEAATPGPWTFKPCEVEKDTIGGDFVTSAAFLNEPFKIDCGDYLGLNDADAAFIAAARTALPEALAEVDRLTARWEALKVNIDAPAVVCSFRGDAYEQALLDVVREMARLEQEP